MVYLFSGSYKNKCSDEEDDEEDYSDNNKKNIIVDYTHAEYFNKKYNEMVANLIECNKKHYMK